MENIYEITDMGIGNSSMACNHEDDAQSLGYRDMIFFVQCGHNSDI